MASRKSAAKDGDSSGKGSVARARGKGGGGFSAKRAWENFKSIAGTIAIFLLLRTFLVEAYRIPSGSMIPSLLIGDWLFVNKLRYGPHLPFTSINLPGYAQPQRGEVVVFESPYQADEAERGEDPTPTLVKRLVGMPGDTIYMRILNDTTRAGWVYDGMTFVPSEASKRPRMAFVIFTREVDLPAE